MRSRASGTARGSRGRAEAGGVGRDALASYVSLVGSSALSAILILVLVRVLPQAEYGRFAVVVSIIGLAVLVADMGVTAGTSRLVAGRAGRAQARGTLVVTAIVLRLAPTVMLAAGTVGFAEPIANAFDDGRLADGIRLVGVAAAGQSLMQFCRLVVVSDGAPRTAARIVLFEGIVEVVTCTAVVLATTSAAATIGGRAAAYAVGSVVGLVVLGRRLGLRRQFSRSDAREILTFAPSSAVVDASWALFLQTPVLLIGIILGSAAVATFEAPMRFVLFAGYVGSALGLATGPRLAAGQAAGMDVQHLRRAVRIVSVIQGALLTLWLGFVAPNAPTIFGRDYEQSGSVFFGLGPYFYLAGISPLLSLVVVYVGSLRSRAIAGVVTLALAVVVNVALLGEIGIAAAIIGANLGIAVHVSWHFRIVSSAIGLAARDLVLPVVECGLLGGACAGGGALLSAITSLPAELGGVVAAAAFLGGTRAVGVWGPDEVGSVKRLVARRPASSGGPADAHP